VKNYPGCWFSLFVQAVAGMYPLGLKTWGFLVMFYEQDCILINYNNSL